MLKSIGLGDVLLNDHSVQICNTREKNDCDNIS
jgi:hypothetical protein